MINFKKTFSLDLIIAVILVGALAVGLLFFGSRISRSVAAIADLKQAIINRSATLKLLASLRGQYAGPVQADLNIMHNIIPSKDALIDLPKEFQSLANQQSLGFGFSFAGETPATPTSLGSVTFKLNIDGIGFDQLFKFAQKLQAFHYLTALDSFSFNQKDKGIEIGITGRVFYR